MSISHDKVENAPAPAARYIAELPRVWEIPVLSSNMEVHSNVDKAFSTLEDGPEPTFFCDHTEFLEYICFETPDVILIDFNEPDHFELLEQINADHWLHCSGVMGLYSGSEDEFLNRVKTSNFVAAVPIDSVVKNLPKVVGIIGRHRNILFQRQMQDTFTGKASGVLVINNDPVEASVHSNLLANYAYNLDLLDTKGKVQLRFVLHELLLNGIEHGNCGISFDEKTKATSEGIFINTLVKQKLEEDPSLNEKKVRCRYAISLDQIEVEITDEGEGFDWKCKLDELKATTNDSMTLFHGRGIMIASDYVSDLNYNEKGNQVSFIFPNCGQQERKVPALFEDNSETPVKAGDVIFTEGEESNALYFIAEGRYRVTDRDGRELAILTPNDIFIGEMAFLLNSKRTANVTAMDDGVLYRISKKKFIMAAQQYPYYSFMLCKILAGRLARS